MQVNGQQTDNFRIIKKSLTLHTDSVTITSSEVFNAMSFRIKGKGFGDLSVKLPNRIAPITKDEHVELTNQTQSNLIVLKEEVTTFTLYGKKNTEIECIMQYVAPLRHNTRALRRAKCEHPQMVTQSTWRQGLPDPVPGRNTTPTEHCIIHHSADGNGNNDYTSLVRAYYTHHTQTNGWDDIGYNYLIANDGTLYAGRDPELPSIDQDNVQGAHFCSKNKKTMGVCIIGEYSSIEPSFAAINTLTDLLTWKLDKERFVVTDSFNHPTTSDPLLSVIDGHKSGCNTTCPGDNLWAKISTIRQDIHNKLDQCSTVGIEDEFQKTIVVYPNPNNGNFIIDLEKKTTGEIQILTLTGKKIYSESILNLSIISISKVDLESGLYILKLISKEEQLIQKIQIIL